MNGSTVPDTYTILPDDVHDQLWERIFVRLDRGDSLITTQDCQLAIESEYLEVTSSDPTSTLKELFRQAIQTFNDEHPEKLVARGVQNSVTRAFQSGVFKLDWDPIRIGQAGESSIERFKTRGKVQRFLEDVQVDPSLIDSHLCVSHAIDVVNGNKELLQPHSPTESLSPEEAPPPPVSPEAREAVTDGTVSQSEVDERAAAENQTRAAIAKRAIDERVASGEIDHAEGERLRNSILGQDARDEIERKLAGAVDYAVRFVQTFEAMKRISPNSDEALRFLIFNKGLLDEDKGGEVMSRAVTDLASDVDLLHEVIDIMDRNDQEIRMISVGLPPYSYIVKRGSERVGNLTIEEDFVDQRRELSSEEMSDKLNVKDSASRVLVYYPEW